MNLPVLVPGILITVAGVGVLLFPVRFTDFTRDLLAKPAARWYAGGIRIVLGAFLFAGSGSASHPAAVATVGALLLVVGAVLLVLPRRRFEAIARWGVGLSPATLQLAAAAAIALGVWLAFEAGAADPADPGREPARPVPSDGDVDEAARMLVPLHRGFDRLKIKHARASWSYLHHPNRSKSLCRGTSRRTRGARADPPAAP